MTKKKMPREAELLIEWQRRLGLQDWSIVLRTECDPKDMEIADSEGCTVWEESTKTASIQIVDPEKIECSVRKFDLEEVLIHELLHLKTTLLSSKDPDDLSERILHQLIDDTARALVDARRAPYDASKNNGTDED